MPPLFPEFSITYAVGTGLNLTTPYPASYYSGWVGGFLNMLVTSQEAIRKIDIILVEPTLFSSLRENLFPFSLKPARQVGRHNIFIIEI